jgi:hypothetical protein
VWKRGWKIYLSSMWCVLIGIIKFIRNWLQFTRNNLKNIKETLFSFLALYLCILPSWLIRFWFSSIRIWLLFIVWHRYKLFKIMCDRAQFPSYSMHCCSFYIESSLGSWCLSPLKQLLLHGYLELSEIVLMRYLLMLYFFLRELLQRLYLSLVAFLCRKCFESSVGK